MLGLPEVGVRDSAKSHNCRVDVLCDWTEARALFASVRVSRSDVIDVLCENHVYREQDFAAEFADQLWWELRRRQRAGIKLFDVGKTGIECLTPWQSNPGYSFCLLASLREWYPKWAKRLNGSYQEQGELFERLSEQSLASRGWQPMRTGWSKTATQRLNDIVDALCAHFEEPAIAGAVSRWTKPQAKDAGLDLACQYPFLDSRGGRPRILVQCASGANWKDKLHTPSLRVWKKIIDFSNDPQRGFCLPHALLDDEFRRTSGSVDGLVLDRTRLIGLQADSESDWMKSELMSDLTAWLTPRVASLPAQS